MLVIFQPATCSTPKWASSAPRVICSFQAGNKPKELLCWDKGCTFPLQLWHGVTWGLFSLVVTNSVAEGKANNGVGNMCRIELRGVSQGSQSFKCPLQSVFNHSGGCTITVPWGKEIYPKGKQPPHLDGMLQNHFFSLSRWQTHGAQPQSKKSVTISKCVQVPVSFPTQNYNEVLVFNDCTWLLCNMYSNSSFYCSVACSTNNPNAPFAFLPTNPSPSGCFCLILDGDWFLSN